MRREKREYVILTFRTTTDAMAMERICGERGISGRLIPVPREITAGCGLSWRMLPEQYKEQQGQLSELPLDPEGIFRLTL